MLKMTVWLVKNYGSQTDIKDLLEILFNFTIDQWCRIDTDSLLFKYDLFFEDFINTFDPNHVRKISKPSPFAPFTNIDIDRNSDEYYNTYRKFNIKPFYKTLYNDILKSYICHIIKYSKSKFNPILMKNLAYFREKNKPVVQEKEDIVEEIINGYSPSEGFIQVTKTKPKFLTKRSDPVILRNINTITIIKVVIKKLYQSEEILQ
jgi:hypothetical protein